MAEPDLLLEEAPAPPPGQRSLPFTYAQQQGVLLFDGNDGPEIICQGQPVFYLFWCQAQKVAAEKSNLNRSSLFIFII